MFHLTTLIMTTSLFTFAYSTKTSEQRRLRVSDIAYPNSEFINEDTNQLGVMSRQQQPTHISTKRLTFSPFSTSPRFRTTMTAATRERNTFPPELFQALNELSNAKKNQKLLSSNTQVGDPLNPTDGAAAMDKKDPVTLIPSIDVETPKNIEDKTDKAIIDEKKLNETQRNGLAEQLQINVTRAAAIKKAADEIQTSNENTFAKFTALTPVATPPATTVPVETKLVATPSVPTTPTTPVPSTPVIVPPVPSTPVTVPPVPSTPVTVPPVTTPVQTTPVQTTPVPTTTTPVTTPVQTTPVTLPPATTTPEETPPVTTKPITTPPETTPVAKSSVTVIGDNIDPDQVLQNLRVKIDGCNKRLQETESRLPSEENAENADKFQHWKEDTLGNAFDCAEKKLRTQIKKDVALCHKSAEQERIASENDKARLEDLEKAINTHSENIDTALSQLSEVEDKFSSIINEGKEAKLRLSKCRADLITLFEWKAKSLGETLSGVKEDGVKESVESETSALTENVVKEDGIKTSVEEKTPIENTTKKTPDIKDKNVNDSDKNRRDKEIYEGEKQKVKERIEENDPKTKTGVKFDKITREVEELLPQPGNPEVDQNTKILLENVLKSIEDLATHYNEQILDDDPETVLSKLRSKTDKMIAEFDQTYKNQTHIMTPKEHDLVIEELKQKADQINQSVADRIADGDFD